MKEKLEELYKKYPWAVVGGGGIFLIIVAFIIFRVFGRPGERPAAMRLPAPTPGFVPTPAVGRAENLLGERLEKLLAGQELRREKELEGIGRRFEGLQQRIEAIIKPTPEPAPVHRPDQNLVQRLQADIQRVTARIGDPQAEQYFQREWGGIQQYLAAQRERLQTAVEGVPTPVAHKPVIPAVAPAQVDQNLVQRLQADIQRVTARIGDPQAEAYFQDQWGGIRQYLASQRERLAAAQRGR